MAKMNVPVKVDGIEVMRKVLGELRVNWELDVSKEYQQGFSDCLVIVRKTLDALEGGKK